MPDRRTRREGQGKGSGAFGAAGKRMKSARSIRTSWLTANGVPAAEIMGHSLLSICHPRVLVALVMGLLLIVASVSVSHAAETWTDSELPVRDGLILWQDASRQAAAWQAAGRPAPVNGKRLDMVYDGSGHQRHLQQRFQDHQPRLWSVDEFAVFRFDGVDDYLGWQGPPLSVRAATIFLVATSKSNAGMFRAFLSAHPPGQNDYVSGLNLDLGAGPTGALDTINVEGPGFGGMRDLLDGSLPFGSFHTFELICDEGSEGVRLWVDGQETGKRDRQPGTMRWDNLTLGARSYSNSTEPPYVSGFLDGDIAEMLVFDRSLTADEREQVRNYLRRKHASLGSALAKGQAGRLLQPLADAPEVQMFVPGFRVRRIPLEVANLNNVRYRRDGALVAVGYNGNIHLLRDTDGDGLEETQKLFYEAKGSLRGPIGMALTPPGYPHGDGVIVASKGKLSLIVDHNGDDQADEEKIIATGWEEIPQNVDAIGVAMGSDGSIYFGLGCANFANGYLVDDKGVSHYDLQSERGTIQRVSPDWKTRETVCTGMRFPVALAMHANGDLFASEQEGATWLPNGNPLDELLHIQNGRHYGFPPRHPRHLPQVIDEPSVFDYGPQHQSTCGMIFNEGINGGPVFGPRSWSGDALVCGESRGKLFRTTLVKTANGYVARNTLIAGLGHLTVDSCVSPSGALVIACHSGPPDWGTGPEGIGRLYKIDYNQPQLPQPLLVYSAGPQSVHVVFDKPVDAQAWRRLADQIRIEYGDYVRAGDRFETMQPPYAVVERQRATPRFDLPLVTAQWTSDRRTLVLETAPHPQRGHYALKLPGFPSDANAPNDSKEMQTIGQHPAMDLDYDLSGIQAEWQDAGGVVRWSGWLPHLDLDVSQALTRGSSEHERLWNFLGTPGQLTLRTQLDLHHMLQPEVQPGSSLDYEPSAEQVKIVVRCVPRGVRLETDDSQASIQPIEASGQRAFELLASSQPKRLVPIRLVIETNQDTHVSQLIRVSFSTDQDARPRALTLRRFLLPWTPAATAKHDSMLAVQRPELDGGNWLKGKSLFHNAQIGCVNCHQLRGRGGKIGPDLANLIHRDYHSVVRDILQPSATLNPDHLAWNYELVDGRTIAGVPLSDDESSITLGQTDGRTLTVAKREIETRQPANVSVMPANYGELLNAEQQRDLLTYLLTDPLQPAPLERSDAPAPRTWADVRNVLAAADPNQQARPGSRPLRIALVAGAKDHGPDEHDYPLWQQRWQKLLSLADHVEVTTASEWPTEEQWESCDLIVLFSANTAWTAAKAADLDRYLQRGGGLVLLHFAVHGKDDVQLYADRVGLAAKFPPAKYRHGDVRLEFPDKEHPIVRGLPPLDLLDETYWNLHTSRVGTPHVVATATEENQPHPILWTYEYGRGRVFASILGHYTWTFDDPLFRILYLRGMMWAVKEPVDRMVELSPLGARITGR